MEEEVKKKFLSFVLFLVISMLVVSCAAPAAAPAPAESSDVPAAEAPAAEAVPAADDVVEDTDTYAGAVMYSDIEKSFGPIPMPASGTTLGFVAKAYENEFWRAVKEGVEAQVKELNDKGVDIKGDVRAAQGESDEQGQAALMNDMVNKKYSAIIASPISDGNLVPPTEKAHAANIPVINAIGGFSSAMDIYVGPKHYMSGELAAEWIAKKLGAEGGEVAVIMGLPKESAARGRTQGFGDWLEKNAPNVKLVDTQNADWDRTKAKDVMDTLMKKHLNLKAIYANNDTMAMGALEAVKSANKLGSVLVIGNDGTSEALQSVKDGELSATVNIYPDFGGKISVDIALRSLAGQKLPKVIYSSQAIIDPTNVAKSAEEVIGWTGLNFAE
jgi:ribose transport system substrate-binding protein